MPVRVRNLRRKILLVLSLLSVQAGLAAGPWRGDTGQLPFASAGQASASRPDAAPVTALAATSTEPAPTEPEGQAPPEPVAAAPSPAATLVPAERLYLEPILAQAARDHAVPVDMILAQAWAESSWRIDAVSNKGATGVLQLMPKAVEFVSKRLLKLDHELDALDPAANARMGARYMQHLLMRTDGDVREALMAYNQGLSGLRRRGPVPAAESYADKVLALRPLFAGQA